MLFEDELKRTINSVTVSKEKYTFTAYYVELKAINKD